MSINLDSSLSAAQRGWGSGWPYCSSHMMESFVFSGQNGGIAFPAGLRIEVIDLCVALLTETEERGYLMHPGWCWGYGCRAIRGTSVPSNHSWGLAVDLNAPVNPLGAISWEMPAWVGPLWNEYGWRWGGNYSGRKDAMHFEFMGTPADAAAMTAKAKEMLVSLNKEQENQLKWVEGFQRYMRGEKEPAKEGPVKRGWNDARIAVEGKVPAH
jgi:hypothetical protein